MIVFIIKMANQISILIGIILYTAAILCGHTRCYHKQFDGNGKRGLIVQNFFQTHIISHCLGNILTVYID